MNRVARGILVSVLLVSAAVPLLYFGGRDVPVMQKEVWEYDSIELLSLYRQPDVSRLYSDKFEGLEHDTRIAVLYNFTDEGLRKFVRRSPRVQVIGLCKHWLGSGPPQEDLCSPRGIEELLALPDVRLLEVFDNYSLDDDLLRKLSRSRTLKRVNLMYCSGFSLEVALTLRPGFFRVIR